MASYLTKNEICTKIFLKESNGQTCGKIKYLLICWDDGNSLTFARCSLFFVKANKTVQIYWVSSDCLQRKKEHILYCV
jgi:hypothetical protein